MKKERKDLHILVVDDLADGRETAVEFLTYLGYEKFTVASDGSEALKALEKDGTIDLILSDWDMPVVNGLTLLKSVRANPKWENIPFVIMTSPRSIEHEKVSLAIEGMVDDYLIKPFRLQTLEDKLEKVLSLTVHGPQKWVVVADDDPDSRDMVVEYLTRFGFKRIQTCEDGLVALDFLKKTASDVGLVIADWEMPKMKGVDLLSHCRSDEKLKDIPFFIITSQVSVERTKVLQAANFNVDQYLLKPFTREELQDRIEGVLARKRSEKEVEELVAQGFGYMDRARYKNAKTCFEKALALDPDYDLSLAGIGDVLLKTKTVEAAIPYWHKANTLNPMRESHYLKLAKGYDQLQSHGKAIHILQAGLTYLKDSTPLRYELARIYAVMEMERKSIEELSRILQNEPGHPDAEALLAKVRKDLEAKVIAKKGK